MTIPTTVTTTCPNGHSVNATDTFCPECGTITNRETVPAAAAPILPTVSGYEILGVLGRGGMGVVYRARHIALNRLVALKMIRDAGLAGPEERARFQAEAQAVARLQHANVVQVHEVGQHQGQPFFSLEYLPGGSLADRLRGTPQPPRASARLVETLARAIHAAHRQGIVHRDLKPANVLLTAKGEPKVGDFGLAKRLDTAGQTSTGAILGTPSYMAPEQAQGLTRSIGPTTDVYALGAILYEMLTGRPPILGATAIDTLQQVIRQDPVPPSRLQPKVPRDLENICLKCLAKEPSRRYGSAAELARDLTHFRKGEPVKARPLNAAGRMLRWARRHPAPAALILVSLLALVATGVGVAGFGYSAMMAKKNDQLEEARQQALSQKDQAEEAKKREADQRRQHDRFRYFAEMGLAQWAWEDQRIDEMQASLERHRSGQHEQPDLPGFEWRYLWRFARQVRGTFEGHSQPVDCVAVSTDGKYLASADNQTVRLWDTKTRKEVRQLPAPAGSFQSLTFRPNSPWLAGCSLQGRSVRVWDSQTGKVLFDWQAFDFFPQRIVFSPDGKRLAAATIDGTVRLCDLDTQQEVARLGGRTGPVRALAFRRAGKELVTVTLVGKLHIWDAQQGNELRSLSLSAIPITGLVLDAQGRLCAGMDRGAKGEALRIWEVDTGKEVRSVTLPIQETILPAQGMRMKGMVLSPDGKHLAAAAGDRTIKVWDLEGGPEPLTLKGHSDIVADLTFSADSRLLASASRDRSVRLWEPVGGAEVLVLGSNRLGIPDGAVRPGAQKGGFHPGGQDVAFRPDGQRLASVTQDGSVQMWDAKTGRPLLTLEAQDESFLGVSFSPDGRLVAALSAKGAIHLWDAETGRVAGVLPGPTDPLIPIHGLGCRRPVFRPDGKRLAAPFGMGVRIWDLTSKQPVLTMPGDRIPVQSVVWRPDGRHLAVVGLQRVSVVDADTGQPVFALAGETGRARDLAYRPDGKRLASASLDGSVHFWDADSGQLLHSLEKGRTMSTGLAYSPDGRRLVTATMDGTARLWDAETGRQALMLKGQLLPVTAVAFSPDGQRVAATDMHGTIRIWEAPPLEKAAR